MDSHLVNTIEKNRLYPIRYIRGGLGAAVAAAASLLPARRVAVARSVSTAMTMGGEGPARR